MFKYIRALGVAGLATIGSSQAGWSAQQSVLWSPGKEPGEVMVGNIREAARAISRTGDRQTAGAFYHGYHWWHGVGAAMALRDGRTLFGGF